MLQFDGKNGPQNLQDELMAAVKFRDAHLEKEPEIVTMSQGGWYRSDKQPITPIIDNFAFEYKTSTLPQLMYDNPQCIVTTKSPHRTDSRGQTLREYAHSMELALNAWAGDNNVRAPLTDAAIDFMYSWGVIFTTVGDQPGWQGAELLPQQPVSSRLSNRHFIIDPKATTWMMQTIGSPRYEGHIWRADLEDLLESDVFDREEVEKLETDTPVGKQEDYHLEVCGFDIPKRKEVIAWDVWVPERGWSDEEIRAWGIENPNCINGTIYTIGVCYSDKGVTRGRYLRDPRPAYVPPWGPYTVFGYDKIKDSPIPLSILMATGEQAYAVNAHAVQNSEDARKYRRFAAAETSNASDAEKYRIIPHGAVGLFENVEKIKQMEAGGVSQEALRQYEMAVQRLDRAAALSSTRRGSAKSHTTATAESIADAGTRTKLSGLQSRYRAGVSQVFRTAAWFMHHGEDVIYELGDAGAKYNIETFFGGAEFPFESLSLEIVPYSHEHTDRTILQRSIMEAIQTVQGSAPIMAQFPFMKDTMTQLMKRLFEVTNVPVGGELVDEEVYQQFLALQQMQLQMKYTTEPNADIGIRRGGQQQQEIEQPMGATPPLENRVKGFLNDAMSEMAVGAAEQGAALV